MKYTRAELEILQRLREIELRLSVLESLPTPIVFAIGQSFPNTIQADMQAPSKLEH